MPQEALQPVGVRVTKDGKKVFVALGPSNRVAVVDGETWEVTGLPARRPAGLAARLHARREAALHHQRHLERRLGDRRGEPDRGQVDPGRRTALGRGGLAELNGNTEKSRGRKRMMLTVRHSPPRWRSARPTMVAAQTRTLEIGLAGLMDSNRTDLPPINLTAGSMTSGGPYELLVRRLLPHRHRLRRHAGDRGRGARPVPQRLGERGGDQRSRGAPARARFHRVRRRRHRHRCRSSPSRPGEYDIRIRGTTGDTQRAAFSIK